MASQTSEQTTGSAERVSFEVERVAFDRDGRLDVYGRWFGVRGRRFGRPTLTMTTGADGNEQRALADLEHKPWAAEDGEPWVAAFPLEVELKEAEHLELSVAPDIAVDLSEAKAASRGAAKGATRKRAPVQAEASAARAPRVRGDRVPARPSTADQALELDRMRTRVASAEREAAREREKREQADRAREDERSEARRLRSEVGRLKSELDIAATARGELAAAASELDCTRAEARDSSSRLQTTIRALDQERAEAERLRMRLTAAEATVERLTRSDATERRRAEQEAAGQAHTINVTTRVYDSLGDDAPAARAPGPYRVPVEPLSHHESPGHRGHARTDTHHPPAARPLHPALSSRPNWPLRLLTVIVLIGVIAAIVVVINSTVA